LEVLHHQAVVVVLGKTQQSAQAVVQVVVHAILHLYLQEQQHKGLVVGHQIAQVHLVAVVVRAQQVVTVSRLMVVLVATDYQAALLVQQLLEQVVQVVQQAVAVMVLAVQVAVKQVTAIHLALSTLVQVARAVMTTRNKLVVQAL
jgi:hypothetical protein